jgi:hypothetical protein
MNRIQVSVLAALAAALTALAAGAALAAEPAKPSFESLDKNSDGKVSLNEAAENDALFVAFKSLGREEFAAYMKDKPSA